MHDFLIRLTSRKFLLTVSTIAGLIAAKHYGEAAGALSAYVIAEAHVDAQAAKAQGAVTKAAVEVAHVAAAAADVVPTPAVPAPVAPVA